MNSSRLNMLTLNVRSLRRHFDDLIVFLKERSMNYHIIILTETWVYSDEIQRYAIPGYNCEFQCRDRSHRPIYSYEYS